jgi:hypothetical protein
MASPLSERQLRLATVNRSKSRRWFPMRRPLWFYSLLQVARTVGLKLCLKYFPGTGGATINPHDEVMDLSTCLNPTSPTCTDFHDFWLPVGA